MTTPSAMILHEVLEQLDANNYTHVAMEASSHGLHQYRLHGVKFKAAAFTNFTQDHLDYHQTMEEYFEAKIKLFTEVLEPRSTAVLNADIPEFQKLKDICISRDINVISYGKNSTDIRICKETFKGMSQKVNLEIFGVACEATLNLFGEFQLYNVLAALGLMIACGEDNIDHLLGVLPKIKGLIGRMDFAGTTPKGANIVIDYAHTPDAFENILTAIRQQVSGRLWIIFGCGGQRDPLKRPIMGSIADRLADVAIVTDDNPRWEDPASIRSQVMSSMENPLEIANRYEAIVYALENMEKGDTLILAGKGHETGQIMKDQTLPFNDFDVVRKVLVGLK
jgi:UDP-N-acetylmuramoyl-L-alanyl-D-glutamate--2,6-diaminopimelate ligase